MCGRYAFSRRPEDLVEEFEVDATVGQGPGQDPGELTPRWNVAPTTPVPVVLERPPRPVDGAEAADDAQDADHADSSPGGEAAVRWLRLLRWGLVPSWAKDRSVGNRMVNARAESVLEKSAFRRAALARRCLVPADGWYEWQPSPVLTDARGRPRRQPFYLHPVAEGPVAFAGLYEFWRDPAVHADDPAAWLTSCTIVTTAAEPGLDVIHDRMPLVLPRDRWDDWLSPTVTDPDAVRALLAPPRPGRFLATAVSTRVNAVAHDGPDLVRPLPADQLRGVVDPATGELIGAEEPLF